MKFNSVLSVFLVLFAFHTCHSQARYFQKKTEPFLAAGFDFSATKGVTSKGSWFSLAVNRLEFSGSIDQVTGDDKYKVFTPSVEWIGFGNKYGSACVSVAVAKPLFFGGSVQKSHLVFNVSMSKNILLFAEDESNSRFSIIPDFNVGVTIQDDFFPLTVGFGMGLMYRFKSRTSILAMPSRFLFDRKQPGFGMLIAVTMG